MIDISILNSGVRLEVERLLQICGTAEPSLEQIWMLMDVVWDELGADNRNPTPEVLSAFYSHPVWLLNGLFIEQHPESLRNREIFSDWVAAAAPTRVADFGGGYGTLARMIAGRCSQSQVEIVDPFPREEAVKACKAVSNVIFRDYLDGPYDVIIATDVFEHVIDPVGLAAEVSNYVVNGGVFLTANHFAPSIKCHLPSTFHFNLSWDYVMRKLGFERECMVSYGTAYRKISMSADLRGARRVEKVSRLMDRFPRVRGSHQAKRYLLAILSRLS